ncbi:hypothetical protein GCM10008906_04520 [Clostridium oceanicum]|uniref:DUF4280 domain-containing protein n=1 Tax=Clostridium oceanicum TaxID=1543 RepID=A0ABN1JA41_9CLOT
MKEDFINSTPTNKTIKDTINPDKYSILPCPKGCSLSAGFEASLNPKNVIIEEAASDKLLNASAMTAILFEISPINNFAINNNTLHKIPTTLAK